MNELLLTTNSPISEDHLIFNLKGPYNSLDDLVDQSVSGIQIHYNGVRVGKDADGSYIEMPSDPQKRIWFGGNVINGPGIIVEAEIKFMDANNNLVWDTRPPNTNGNYSFLGLWGYRYLIRLPDTATNTSGVNGQSTGATSYQIKRRVRLEYLPEGSSISVDGVKNTLTRVFNHTNQYYRIGYHAFNLNTQRVRLYSFKVWRQPYIRVQGPITARFIRLSNPRPAGTGYLTISELQAIDETTGINYCLEPGVTVQTNMGGYQGIQNPENILTGIIDEDPTNRWSSASQVGNGNANNYFQVDLGEVRTFDTFKNVSITGGGQALERFTLQTSEDGETWTSHGYVAKLPYTFTNVPVVVLGKELPF